MFQFLVLWADLEKFLNILCYNKHSARSVTTGKFDKCLHFLSIFIAQKLTVGLIIRYVSLNITKKNYP
jgi:hypothetical protein